MKVSLSEVEIKATRPLIEVRPDKTVFNVDGSVNATGNSAILSNHCFECHGPDEDSREADLRLDLESNAVESAIVVGKADESEVINRVTSDDDDLRMPPVGSGDRVGSFVRASGNSGACFCCQM